MDPSHLAARKRRSRTGCFTCRQRKVRCDEHRPVCTSCQRLKLTCTYPAAERSSQLGRQGTSKKSHDGGPARNPPSIPADTSPSPSRHRLDEAPSNQNPFGMTTSTDLSAADEALFEVNWLESLFQQGSEVPLYENILSPDSFLEDSIMAQQPLDDRKLNRTVTICSDDSDALQHYTDTMTRFCILRNNAKDNLYNILLLKMGLFHKTLFDAMMSWSALHMAHIKQESMQESIKRYQSARTALTEDIEHGLAPDVLLVTIWFLMQFQILLAQGIEELCALIGLAADIAGANFKETSSHPARIGPVGSMVLVWMCARDCQVAYLGQGGKLLGCLRAYPHIYDFIDKSSVLDIQMHRTQEQNESNQSFYLTPASPIIAADTANHVASQSNAQQMQACMGLSFRIGVVAGQIQVLACRSLNRPAWDSVRTSLDVLQNKIERHGSSAARAALSVAIGNLNTNTPIEPLQYNRLLLLSGYYVAVLRYQTHCPVADEAPEVLCAEECANRVLRICQRVASSRPDSPQGTWSTHIFMAAIATRDPIYQQWAIQALEKASTWGPNMVKTYELLKMIIERQNLTGNQENLLGMMMQTTGVFLL